MDHRVRARHRGAPLNKTLGVTLCLALDYRTLETLMSAGVILTVLSNIPWAQVVENAPKVAEAAGKLWSRVARRNAETTEELVAESQRPVSEAELLKRRVDCLEEELRALQDEMRASSQLIKDLAEQNTVLVQRIELNRLKLVRLTTAATLGFAVLLSLSLFLLVRA